LAIVFLVAGAAKLADREGSRSALIGFGVAERLARPMGVLLPLVELAVAGALLAEDTAWWGALGALALLTSFVVGISLNLARGRTPDCHCFGQIHSAPAGLSTLGRNGVLAAVAAFVVSQGPNGAGPSAVGWISRLDAGTSTALAVGVVTLGALAAGGWLILTMLRQHGRLLLRVEALEARLDTLLRPGNGDGHHPASVQQRWEAEPSPTFRLPDLTGAYFELWDFRGSETLLLFWDPADESCRQILEDVRKWEWAHPVGSRKLVFISTGSIEANRSMGLSSLILLDSSGEVARAFDVSGTPSAVLLDKEAKVASRVAVGGAEVLRLGGFGAATVTP
jgi:peroxiredoxin